MNAYNYKVIDAKNEECPNLIGVFKHVFPIAAGHARASGQDQFVRYHGETYRIRPTR